LFYLTIIEYINENYSGRIFVATQTITVLDSDGEPVTNLIKAKKRVGFNS